MDFVSIAELHRSLVASVTNGDEEGNTQPIFSPSAEAELYLLCTNFLLYVALVIVTTLIARVYFPETLDPSLRAPAKDVTEEVDATETEGLLMGADEEQQGNSKSFGSPKKRRVSFDFEFDQKQMPRMVVLKRLVFCSLMLNLTFVTWGVLQERMLTRRYPRLTGEYFIYSYALVFSNRFWTFLLASALLLYIQPSRSRSVVLYEYSFPSVSNLLSSWCQYEALRYVSFPATTLFKSFKLAPVMLMGKVLGNKECKFGTLNLLYTSYSC